VTTFQFDQDLENKFVSLVEESWKRYDDIERNSWLDDVFVGASITAHLDNGMFLLDATSDGKSHYFVFADQERNRNVLKVDHRRGEDYLYSKTVGHLTAVTLAVGRAYPDLKKLFKAARSEVQSGMAGEGRIAGYEDPGVMKVDREGSIATCETTLLLDLNDYVRIEDLSVDREKLWIHFQATYQSLEKYLSGIMA